MVSGFTSTVDVTAAPVHPFAVGVMVNVTLIGTVVVLVNVPLISPETPAAIPVTETVLSLVQLNTVPLTLLALTMVVMAEPEHLICEDGVATALAFGFTSTVAAIGVLVLYIWY